MKPLIKKLEAATQPDSDLDADIYAALGAKRPSEDSPLYWTSPDGTSRHYDSLIPAYTRSIDAALMLVPEHYSYELTQSAVEPPAMARARLWDWRRGPTGIDPGNEWKSEGNRPLAMAICIAALRVRDQQSADGSK